MSRNFVSIAGALVLAAAAFFATAQPSQAVQPRPFYGHVHHGGHFGHQRGYYPRAYRYGAHYGGYYRPYQVVPRYYAPYGYPAYGGYYHYSSPYFGYPYYR